MNKVQRTLAAAVVGLATIAVGVTHADARPVAPKINEDDPRWDCRTMGNRQCGVKIEGAWYVVTFDAKGKPKSVRVR